MECRHYLDYGIIFVCRIIRGYFAGVFALLLIQNLLLKGLSFAEVSRVQFCLLAGCLIASKLTARLAKTLGVVNTLVVASFVKCVATFVFAHAKSSITLSTAAAFGCFAIYGEWFCPFLAFERKALGQLAKDPAKTEQQHKAKLQKLLTFHNAVGCIAILGGLVSAANRLRYNFYFLFVSLKDSGEVILTQCAFAATACFLLYALLDRKKIEADSDSIAEQSTSGSDLLLSLVYCLEGIYTSIFSQSYLIYFLRNKYRQNYGSVLPILTNIFNQSIICFIIFILVRRRINGIYLYFFTSIVPNILVLLFGILYAFYYPIREFSHLIFLFGIAAYSQRPSLINNLFAKSENISNNWLVAAGYLVGGGIGLMLQRQYQLIGLPISIAGVSRLLVDVIILASYAMKRKEIGPFSNLFLETLPRNTQNGNKEIVEHEEI